MGCKKIWFSFVKKNQKAWSAEKSRLSKPRLKNLHEYFIIIFNTFRTQLPSKIKQNKKTKSKRRQEEAGGRKGGVERKERRACREKRGGGREGVRMREGRRKVRKEWREGEEG